MLHQLGQPERDVERLAGVQPRVAERLVAVRELLLEHAPPEPPRHSVTSSPVYSRWTPPGQTPSARQAAKKPSISAMIASKCRVLTPGGRHDDVRVHRIADPDDRVLGLADGQQERRQQLLDALGAHPDDQRQPPRHPAGIQPLAQLDRHPRATLSGRA